MSMTSSSSLQPAPAGAPAPAPVDIPRTPLGTRIKRHFIAIIHNPKLLRRFIVRVLIYLVLLDLAYVFLYPYLYMAVTSLKTNADLYNPTVNWIPNSIKWLNYQLAYGLIDFTTGIKNSAIYTVIGTLGHLLSCAFIGYGLARYEFPGKKIWFGVVLIAIVIPAQALLIPYYIMYANLKMMNTYLPVLLPTFVGFGLQGPLFIFVFRQFFQGLPKELEDAARVDGCGHIRTFFSIVLPISKAVFMVVLVLSMVWHWNDYIQPSMFAGGGKFQTLPAGLAQLSKLLDNPTQLAQWLKDHNITDPEAMLNNAVFMAGTIITIAPIAVIFMFLQRQFMQGIERTGLVE
ncbi:MAG: carbohydrate ABC transporter permease [Oscillospiraceae bacterium]|nr:carbohydrate ABC transporter permease [Oscillospiraceae bacterium]